MTQFKGSATVFRVLKALEWHEKADDFRCHQTRMPRFPRWIVMRSTTSIARFYGRLALAAAR